MNDKEIKILKDKTILILDCKEVEEAMSKYTTWLKDTFGYIAYHQLSPQHTMGYFPDIFFCAKDNLFHWGGGAYCQTCKTEIPKQSLTPGYVCVDFVLTDYYIVKKGNV